MSIYPITPIDSSTVKAPLPRSLVVDRGGLLYVQHYYGNSARPDASRLWIVEPARHAREVTTGDRSENFPGDIVAIEVEDGETIRLGINGITSSAGAAYPSHTRYNDTDNARVHDIDPSHGTAGWYIEWEDLDLVSNGSGGYTNSHYNDSRTLVYFRGGGFLVGKVGIAPPVGIG